MTPTAAQMAADFRRAADVIRVGGLAKETYENDLGQHCTIGALRVATCTGQVDLMYGMVYDTARVEAEMKVAAGLLGAPEGDVADRVWSPGFNTITTWNDAEERTPEDVITLLEQAAEKLEAEL